MQILRDVVDEDNELLQIINYLEAEGFIDVVEDEDGVFRLYDKRD